ncbi:MAG: hypothetical protein WBY88_11560, partial [Desulfosarcina sp.]
MASSRGHRDHRLERASSLSLKSWQPATGPDAAALKSDAVLDMGWGRIIFGHTFQSNEVLYDT